ncbi:hypothetical protein [Amycolatopsis sp. SID8362]|uniref:hypothetical protein n=1 Tax=Amycolatopsis sp. SID8362 TaxID=2690346 RepID=UPI001367C02A|nr:hypothetical protein [Amycolatopsis sp. SID8362]NBH04279.1 hypothetical protein [Amycolatopsis sp. SID8362]NED40978.1 hypothetical protein [Amycolatopsis sp. SID8362]
MTRTQDNAAEVLRAVWSAEGANTAELDEACGTKKQCRNMKHVSFDGFAETGGDLGTAWRDKLRREGKLDTSAGSIRDLVLGADAPR